MLWRMLWARAVEVAARRWIIFRLSVAEGCLEALKWLPPKAFLAVGEAARALAAAVPAASFA